MKKLMFFDKNTGQVAFGGSMTLTGFKQEVIIPMLHNRQNRLFECEDQRQDAFVELLEIETNEQAVEFYDRVFNREDTLGSPVYLVVEGDEDSPLHWTITQISEREKVKGEQIIALEKSLKESKAYAYQQAGLYKLSTDREEQCSKELKNLKAKFENLEEQLKYEKAIVLELIQKGNNFQKEIEKLKEQLKCQTNKN